MQLQNNSKIRLFNHHRDRNFSSQLSPALPGDDARWTPPTAASRKRVFAAVTEDNSDADENQSLACQMCQGDGHHMLYIDKLDDIS